MIFPLKCSNNSSNGSSRDVTRLDGSAATVADPVQAWAASIMDFMIMMPLGPLLMRELSLSAVEFSMLIAAYTMMAGVVGLATAPFIDRFDRRVVLLVSYIGFIVGTYACAISESAGSLLVARAVWGAFGGVSNATLLAIVGIWYRRRGEARQWEL